MKELTWFLARRYLFKSTYENNIGIMMVISFLGIVVGSCSLALVTAITNGFRTSIYEKMQGIHAQVIIKSRHEPINVLALQEVLKNEFPQVIGVSPTSTQHGIIHLASDASEISAITLIKAIDPEHESDVSVLQQKIVGTTESLHELLQNNQVIIGTVLSKELELGVGDTFKIMYPSEKQTSEKRIIFDTTTATIGGLFKTGIDELDSSVIICSFDFFNTLFPETGIEQLNLRLAPGSSETATIQALKERTELDVNSWKDLYPALVSALTLEQYVSFLIISLIALVASLNMISLLFMQITQKKTDIALLRVLGASHRSIMTIFIAMGMIITTSATICGLMLAFAISWVLEKYPFIQLPDVYYVTHLPSDMTWSIAISVFFVVIMLSLFAIIIPVRSIKNLNIAQVLRFEG